MQPTDIGGGPGDDARPTARLAGRVAVVTGGTSGIGAAVVRRLVRDGASVVIADIDVDGGGRLADMLGDPAEFQRCDVTSETDVETAVAAAVDRWGRLDIMHNNAGLVGPQDMVDRTGRAEWTRTLDVLLTAVFLGTKHAVAPMRAGGGGVIINTASVCGLTGGLGPHAYTAAKHAVIGLTRSTALELADDNIRVNAICPGYIVTELTVNAVGTTLEPGEVDNGGKSREEITRDFFDRTQPLGRAGEADDVAAAVVWMASDECSWMTGAVHVVDGGLTAGVPFRRPIRSMRRD